MSKRLPWLFGYKIQIFVTNRASVVEEPMPPALSHHHRIDQSGIQEFHRGGRWRRFPIRAFTLSSSQNWATANFRKPALSSAILKAWGNFRQRALALAIRQINANTDLMLILTH
ncbi:MAG: hypothetical protein JO076_06880 [Verrucomicrobia bacterium]|nr:hypothetical protein [Verrucomicrobiota bacterium]